MGHFFFFNDTATTEIYTLSLHDALPISFSLQGPYDMRGQIPRNPGQRNRQDARVRSEEHTSELQSQSNLVCRLLLEKKKKSNTMQCRNRRQRATASSAMVPQPPATVA